MTKEVNDQGKTSSSCHSCFLVDLSAVFCDNKNDDHESDHVNEQLLFKKYDYNEKDDNDKDLMEKVDNDKDGNDKMTMTKNMTYMTKR